jgi:hypothetical protein
MISTPQVRKLNNMKMLNNMNNKAPFIRVKKVPSCHRIWRSRGAIGMSRNTKERQATMSPYHREHEEQGVPEH